MSSSSRGGQPLPASAVGLMLLLSAAWGLNMVAVKLGNAGIPPVLQAGLRSVVAALLLLAWCRLRGIGFAGWRDPPLLRAGLLAGALFGLEFLLLYVGLEWTTASRGIVFLFSAPFFVALGVHWLAPDDRLTPAKALGLVVAFAGLLLAFADAFTGQGVAETLLGDATCLLAGVVWGMTTVVVKVSALSRARAELVLQYQLVVSALLLLPAALMVDRSLAIAPTPLVAGAFLYQAVGIAFVTYTAWFWLVGRHSASRLAVFSFLSPLFGVLAGWLLMGDPLGPIFLLAVALVAAGIWLVNRPARG
jgi:drug/metabolite transporter (DMT)-like permease